MGPSRTRKPVVILDTNTISALLDGDRQLSQVLDTTTRHHLPLVALAEYAFGLQSSKYGARLKSVFRKLETDSILLLPDRATADWYVTIRHKLKLRGRPIPEGDLWIAALARQHDLEIISRDEHFDVVEGVRRIGW